MYSLVEYVWSTVSCFEGYILILLILFILCIYPISVEKKINKTEYLLKDCKKLSIPKHSKIQRCIVSDII